MQALGTALKKIAEPIQTDLLRSALGFPRTDSLKDDKPCMVYSLEKGQSLNWIVLRKFINANPDAIALTVHEDLLSIIDVMEGIAEELMLAKFDQIHFYHGGLDIFRITLGNDVGRSVLVNVNDYRMRVNAVITQSHEGYAPFIVGVLVGLFGMIVYNSIIWERK